MSSDLSYDLVCEYEYECKNKNIEIKSAEPSSGPTKPAICMNIFKDIYPTTIEKKLGLRINKQTGTIDYSKYTE